MTARPTRVSRDLKAVLIALGIAAGAVLLIFTWFAANYRKERLDFCSGCGSKRHTDFRRLFTEGGPRTPFTSDYERIEESRVHEDFLRGRHAHDWVMSWLAVDGLGGLRASGAGHNSRLRLAYERDPGFREFLKRRMESDVLTGEQIVLLLTRTAAPPSSARIRGEPEPPLDPRELDLVERGALEVAEYEASLEPSKRVHWIHAAADRQPPPR